MRIKLLHIKNSSRLLNKGTNEILWEPQSPHQLLMGPNGAGKSTLMSEFSLLPAEAKKFTKTGYKKVIAEHNGIDYTVISDFASKHVHSFFIGDGPNLNDGGTITIQKLLLEEHLGYTQDIHNLLLGNINITQLSTNARKELFAKLSAVNVDFGLKVYSKLKTEARNVIGARKHLETQLLKENSKLLTKEEIVALKQNISDINVRIEHINKSRDGFIPPEVPGAIHRVNTEIDQYVADLEALGDLPNCLDLSLGDFTATCRSASEEVTSLKSTLDGLYREQELVINMRKLLDDEDVHPISDLKDKLVQLQQELSTVVQPSVPMDDLEVSTAPYAISALEGLLDDLDAIYGKLQVNPNGTIYNGATLEQARNNLDVAREGLSKLENLISRDSTKLNNLKLHDPITCPGCNHVWVPGVSELEVQALTQKLESLDVDLQAAKKEVLVSEIEFNEVNDYAQLRRTLMTYGAQYPTLKHYFKMVSDHKDLNDAPSRISVLTRQYLKSVKSYLAIDTITKSISELSAAITKREASLQQAIDLKVEDQTTKLEQSIFDTIQKLKVANDQVTTLKSQYTVVTRAQAITDKLTEAMDKFYRLQKQMMATDREVILKDASSLLSAEHYANWQKLNELEAVNKVVAHMNEQLEELEVKQKEYEMLMRALSPTSGIIAKTLVGFMNELFSQINNVIKRIWVSELKVGACGVARDEFTYRFPVSTGFNKYDMTDISEGSTAELDIINFSFKLISMQYLSLSGYPLLIDELGSSFTATHKRRLYDYLKLLVDSGTVSQLIAISHFTDTVDELNRADINVIDASGLLVPENANKNFHVS